MKTTHDPDVGERRAQESAGRPLGQVLMAVAVFYVVAALFNGAALYEGASRKEIGPARDFWMGVTRPMSSISKTLNLHVLRKNVETLRKEP